MTQSDLVERIQAQYEQLSASQRMVAETLIRDPKLLAFGTAAAIGRAVGVSESTVIRLAYTLGYKGFADLQEHAQGALAPKLMPDFISRAATEFPGGAGLLDRVLEHDVKLLRQTREQNTPESLDRAAALLANAQHIFVSGTRASYGIAHFFWYTLRNQVGTATFLEVDTPPFLNNLAEMTPLSALVTVSFPRYSSATIKVARYASSVGCPIIAITDNPLSPLARMATVVLTSSTESVAATMSYVPVLSLLTALLTGVALKSKPSVDRRLAQIESVHTRWQEVSSSS